MGSLMYVGTYSTLFTSAITPWTTLGPLAGVVAFSLLQEGLADLKRHRSDAETNAFPCMVLKRSENVKPKKEGRVNMSANDQEALKNVGITFASVRRENIYAGDVVLMRNREMVPADVVLLASSNENGSVYIETSSIDGETNLKLRTCPNVSAAGYGQSKIESLGVAASRIASFSALSKPMGKSALQNPQNLNSLEKSNSIHISEETRPTLLKSLSSARVGMVQKLRSSDTDNVANSKTEDFVGALSSELPNASVNTFSGKITLPPADTGNPSIDVPLGAENLLLRGAMLRNTEWAIGVSCFTGKDTKLVKNAVKTTSKLSQLDKLVNMTIIQIIIAMVILAATLGAFSVYLHENSFSEIWYLGYSKTEKHWPYLQGLEIPEWNAEYQNFFQIFLTFITLNNNFVPLSLYISIEMVTGYFMWLVGTDKNMYHEETDTHAIARSTNVTDLGSIKYVFSDKTGTLTQNVMKFKRCSIDGNEYGDSVVKKETLNDKDEENPSTSEIPSSESLPLNKILAETNPNEFTALQGIGTRKESLFETRGKLSFNAEMFLRVMSLCHTVVVEKEYGNNEELSIESSNSSMDLEKNTKKDRNQVVKKIDEIAQPFDVKETGKGPDGAPFGFAYQAESPDEGALVSAASLQFGFQVLSRESNGIRLACASPSLLEDKTITDMLKQGKKSVFEIAAQTALQDRATIKRDETIRTELWSVLAVNKFESDRKRMSILVRSPPELGSIPLLLCKGADSAMLNSDVCEGADMIIGDEDSTHSELSKSICMSFRRYDNSGTDDNYVSDKTLHDFTINAALGIQSHLGNFASEGLRTLVLGIRILTEDECESWLKKFELASTTIKDRDKRLKEVALEIETKLHIVGATAIEDKLQDGVPETIAKLADAGIKLWVLTGDKRETAIEIGYSTKVLTPNMRLIQMKDSTKESVKYTVAKEFMKLVKKGHLPKYQRTSLKMKNRTKLYQFLSACWHTLTGILGMIWGLIAFIFNLVFFILEYTIKLGQVENDSTDHKTPKRKTREDAIVSRRAVRDLAENIIETHKSDQLSSIQSSSVDGETDFDLENESEETPQVFNRAASARAMIEMRSGSLKNVEEKSLRRGEDVLSLSSIDLKKNSDDDLMFEKKRRTVFEAMFAVDREVRHGHLRKHLNPDYDFTKEKAVELSSRALVVEGGALLHLLGDPIMEEMLFAVASNCDSVIACRVSPKQKALLVNLVRNYVSPEPVTLAIGDGANDVGMIQEAHVGVGISGLEGQQAVNSSDFAIAQFRFLQQLLLIHGRWNFMRMSKLVLFSFYKNALLVGTLTFFSTRTLFSGTPIYDQWIVSMLNFVSGFPIVFTGAFDRDLEMEYVMANPEVYSSGPKNEFLNLRMIYRWVITCLIHTFSISLLSLPNLSLGGGQAPAFYGLMRGDDPNHPGEGEGGDLKSVGVVIFTILIFTLAYKVIYCH